MCHCAESVPPFAISATRGARGAPTDITSEDGTRFAAYVADPGDAGGAGVVVLPDDRGLSPFYEQLALGLAEQGHPAVAIDWFGRPTLRRQGMEDDVIAGAA